MTYKYKKGQHVFAFGGSSDNYVGKCGNPRGLDEGTYKIIASTDPALKLPHPDTMNKNIKI
jgi:hypothetical protein